MGMRGIRLIFRFLARFAKFIARLLEGGDYKRVSYASETGQKDLLKAKVRYVIDGDTVIVCTPESEFRVRLSAIDCPEDGQDGGDAATKALIKLILGRFVHLETYGLDPHGRTLATIYVMIGSELINVNERMVMLGHAWVMPQYYGHLSKSRRWQLNRLERWARSKRIGLWKVENPTPPWEYRRAG